MAKPTAAELLARLATQPMQAPPPIELGGNAWVDEYEGAPPPPQPQHFVLQLPADLTTIWEEPIQMHQVDSNGQVVLGGDGQPLPYAAWPGDTGLRVVFRFDGINVLKIVSDQGRGGPYVGEPLHTRMDFRERNRARRGDQAVMLSDGHHLIKALYERDILSGQVKIPGVGDNAKFVELLLGAAGRMFGADWEWSSYCNPKRGAQTLVDGQFVDRVDGNGQALGGCGARMYQRDWPKDSNGLLYPMVNCPKCQSLLRPFGNLRRFKAVG